MCGEAAIFRNRGGERSTAVADGAQNVILDQVENGVAVRMALLYLVASWLLLQVTDVLSSLLPVPEWTGSLVFILLAIGLVVVVVIIRRRTSQAQPAMNSQDIERASKLLDETNREQRS